MDIHYQENREELQQKNCLSTSKKGHFYDIIYLQDKFNQKVYAVKSVKIKDEVTGDTWKEIQKRTENEIAVLRELKHPFIVKFYDYYKNKQNYNLITECYFDDLEIIQ